MDYVGLMSLVRKMGILVLNSSVWFARFCCMFVANCVLDRGYLGRTRCISFFLWGLILHELLLSFCGYLPALSNLGGGAVLGGTIGELEVLTLTR